jgi:large subunit ribosomal protein L4
MRSFEQKVNRKAVKAALRTALTNHASRGTLAVLDASVFAGPSTKQASSLIGDWGKEWPLVVVATEDEDNVIKSFRNLDRVHVATPFEGEVAALVWARSLVVTEASLEALGRRAS